MITLEQIDRRMRVHRPQPADMTGRAQAAVALVFVPGSGAGPELLLIRRAEVDGDPWSGQMGLPGGRREDADADLVATARRETQEETGIALDGDALVGVLDDLAPMSPVLPPIVVRPFVFVLPAVPRIVMSREVAGYVWEPLPSIVDSAAETEIVIMGVRRTMPAFQLGENTVWGMTHRIINNFIDITST